MSETELKPRLERALRQDMMKATWDRLKASGMVKEYLAGDVGWDDLKSYANELLDFQAALLKEERGQGTDLEGEEDIGDGLDASRLTPVTGLSARTRARARALSERYAHLAGESNSRPETEPLKVSINRRDVGNGEDLELMLVIEVDVWVPPEDVARVYRNARSSILDEEASKTDEGTLEVAGFVWREERRNGGKRPSWPVLLDLWKREHPEETRKWSYNNFRQYFTRGRDAAIPRYKKVLFPLPPEKRAEAEEWKRRFVERLSRSGTRFVSVADEK